MQCVIAIHKLAITYRINSQNTNIHNHSPYVSTRVSSIEEFIVFLSPSMLQSTDSATFTYMVICFSITIISNLHHSHVQASVQYIICFIIRYCVLFHVSIKLIWCNSQTVNGISIFLTRLFTVNNNCH